MIGQRPLVAAPRGIEIEVEQIGEHRIVGRAGDHPGRQRVRARKALGDKLFDTVDAVADDVDIGLDDVGFRPQIGECGVIALPSCEPLISAWMTSASARRSASAASSPCPAVS
ncbi:hypothetical protein, partial [Mycolicibacterium sp. CBMA 361]|uniref:hypothetical protein n=1 Tax=Mycolicibacterium sp. CBMA 361 TaxID=2606610 RepID=UPI0012DC8EC8